MSQYRDEQLASQRMVARFLAVAPRAEQEALKRVCAPYLAFRTAVARFQARHLQALCTRACFQNRLSACCNRDAIITFFADLVVNALVSTADEMTRLLGALENPRPDLKCIYLADDGCLWQIKPIVCAMFVCEKAQQTAFASNPALTKAWRALEQKARRFRWPDRPVLFDTLEARFLAAGCCSPLMYLHNSPGLLRIKRKAGLA
jgi:hypothetical protein